MATTPPYTVTINNVATGTYSVTAKATGSLGGTAVSPAVNLVVADNAAPTVTLVTNPATADAPAAVTLTATATDGDGTVAKVEFFNGQSLLATVTQAPYAFTWNDVAAGSYALTARATDNLGLEGTAAVQALTITTPAAPGAAQIFYIYSDQINTAREITNAAGVKVWQADPEPFGANLPNENPAGQGAFTYNQRFPGQYFDKEIGLHYNMFRNYDPSTGRYLESDPIGLRGGLNTYRYVYNNPLGNADPLGLSPKCKMYGTLNGAWEHSLVSSEATGPGRWELFNVRVYITQGKSLYPGSKIPGMPGAGVDCNAQYVVNYRDTYTKTRSEQTLELCIECDGATSWSVKSRTEEETYSKSRSSIERTSNTHFSIPGAADVIGAIKCLKWLENLR